jgi:PAS domain S-box-containing protein
MAGMTDQQNLSIPLSEATYQELIEHSNSIILRIDTQGRLTYANLFAENFFGYGRGELIGRPVVGTLVPPTDQFGQDLAEMMADILVNPNKYASNENENTRQNGDRVWISWSNQPITDSTGRLVEVLCIGNDISRRKRAEEALREAEARFRSIFENSVEGMFQTTPAGQYLRANAALAHLYGYDSPEELVKTITNIERQLYVDPNRRGDFMRFIQERGQVHGFEAEIYRQDGSTIWISETARMVEENGSVAFYEGTVTDITQRKQIEAEILQHNVQLAAFNRVAIALTAATEIKAALGEVTREIVLLFKASYGSLALLTPDKMGLELIASHAIGEQPPLEPSIIPLESNLVIQQVVKSGQGLMVNEAPPNPPNESLRNWRHSINGHSLLVVPLIVRGHVIGTLSLNRRQPEREFSAAEFSLAETLAGQVSGAVENFRLLDEARHRSNSLQTAAEVSQAANSILDVNDLIHTSVNLIRDEYDFYYVGMFLVDERREWAVLQTGTGEAGKVQLAKGHKLKIGGASMIGWCIEHRQARIALDVGVEAVRFNNPHLPETRSEMALPLISRDEVIGALTVQSTRPAAFTAEDVTLLQTMADQLANAIANARLFESAAAARSEAEERLQETLALQELSQALSGSLAQEQILQLFFQACTSRIGFEYVQLSLVELGQNRVRALAGVGMPEQQLQNSVHSLDANTIAVDIIRTGRTEIISGWDERVDRVGLEADTPRAGVRVFTPITLRRENIGLVEAGFNSNVSPSISAPQVRLLQAFVVQTALALDNARRYEASQRMAEREALTKEIINKIRASNELGIILATTVQEIGRAIGSKRAVIQIDAPAGNSGFGVGAQGNPPSSGGIGYVFSDSGLSLLEAPLERESGQSLSAPIQIQGQTLGQIRLDDPERDYWSIEDISLLEEISSQVALAIDHALVLDQSRERSRELSILFDATRQLTETIDLQQIYTILARQVTDYLNGDRCTVLALNPARTHFEAIVEKSRDLDGRLADRPTSTKVALDDAPSLSTILKKPQALVHHFDDPDLDAPTRQRMAGDPVPFQTTASFPLLARDRGVGVLEVAHLKPHPYSQNELQLVQAIVGQVAVAIENAQLFQQTQVALADTQRLFEISTALVESSSVDDVFETIIETVRSYEVDRVSISLFDKTQSGEIVTVTIVSTWDQDESKRLPVGTKFSADSFSLVHAFAQPPFHPLISHDLRRPEGQDPRMDDEFRTYVVREFEAVTLFSAPMFLGSEYKGVMSIYTRKPHLYTDQEIRIYQTLADQAIIAIENYRLLEQTRAERDRASLLYEVGQALNRPVNVEDVEDILLSFTPKIGATHTEIYITDGESLFSGASTVPSRQDMAPKMLAELAFSQGPESSILGHGTKLVRIRRAGHGPWPLANLPDMQTLVCIPFRSTRSTLHGVLTFLHSEPDGFSPEQMAVFEAMAQQTAATLENVWLLQQTRRVLDETEVLYRATRRFNSAQKVDDLLHTLVSSFSQTIPQLDSMLLATVPLTPNNRAPDFCQVVAAWERAGDGIREADFKLARTRFSFMNDLRFDSPLEVAYHQLTPDVKAAVDEQLFGLRSLLLVPMVVGPEWVGLLLVGSRTDGYMFELPAQNQIVTLAGQAAVIIQNLQLVAETQKNLFHTEILSNLGHQLLATDLAEVMYDLAVSAVAATEPDRGAVSAVIKRGGDTVELEMVAWWDTPGQDWMASLADLPRYEPIAEVIGHFDGNQALVINQTDAGECFSPELHHLLSETMQICDAVVVPLWYNRCVQGIILIASHSQKFFKTDTLRLYEDIARETSGALENRRLFDEVEGRARQLATAAEVSQAATAYLDLDTLLSKAVDLIKERFNFYHVSIFLVDEYQKFAVVHAATDQVGREMLAKGYRLPVGGQSIVGIATASGKPRVVQNIKDDVRTTVNLLLPHIRSEMALPLTVQGRVIGALDVKSTELGAFDESDITILMSMANQLANAIQAARAVEEANQAVAEINKLHQHYLQAEWVTFFRGQQPAIRYSLAESGDLVEAESDPLSLMQAAQFKRPTLIAGEPAGSAERPSAEPVNGAGLTDDSPTANNPLTLVAPLILNGQAMIGSLEFALDRARGAAVDDDTLHIVEAVANQAAQAIEAARLFEETQISREEAEALYEVGRLLIATEDEQEMFNAVLGKMLGVMGLVQGGVLLFDEDRVLGRLYALYRGGRPVEPDLVFPIKGNPSYELLIKSKQPVAIEDMATDPLVEPVRALNLASGLKSLLLVPIIINDEVIGALGADSVDKKHIFTEREKNLAAAMADQLAISLLNRRLFKEQQETAKRLKEIDKLKTQFLANMSHELRTPLNSIIGFSRVILKGIDGPLTELQKADLTSIHNSGHHLLGLINNILDLSKIEAGRMELNFETVEIEPVVKTVMSTAIALVKDKRVELVRQLPPALPTIQADPTRLRQIILNLVSNACKFTEQGTVTLAVQADQEHVIFSVIDTGIGISEEQMSSIFEEFTQVDGSTTRKAGGTGLGLPISRHFAELHGGEIWVTSTPGQGSTFSFSIPIRLPERETKADQGVENVVAPSHKRSILIIDNDPQVVALYERFLSGGDFEVNTVDLKQDIIAQVKAFHPYVILLDVILTGWDGWGLLKTLKDNSFTKDIPVIVCSIAGDKNRGFSLGASAYLIKPITETELIEALKTVEAQRQRDEVRVLIVDDKADDVLLIRRMLEVQANYNISEASNGKEGLELIKLKRPDLIILDLNMPEMDGFAMMEELKENEHTRSIPIIVVSADELSAENYDRLSGQVEVLLRKGIFTELELLEDVSKALGQRQEVML